MQKGGDTLWEELYEAHYRELSGLRRTHVRQPRAGRGPGAGDLCKGADERGDLEDLSPGKQRAWLYRTFKNLFFDYYRRSVLEAEYVQGLRSEAVESSGIQNVETGLLLQTISPQDRTIFLLRYYEGYTAKEIAELLHLPAGTVRSRLSRCRKYLKEQL